MKYDEFSQRIMLGVTLKGQELEGCNGIPDVYRTSEPGPQVEWAFRNLL